MMDDNRHAGESGVSSFEQTLQRYFTALDAGDLEGNTEDFRK